MDEDNKTNSINENANSINEKIRSIVDGKRDEIIDFLADLVKLPTVNHPPTGDEISGQLFFEKACNNTGLKVDKFTPYDVAIPVSEYPFLRDRDFNNRFNVVATWNGSGGGRSLLLSGHMDVVPVGSAPWSVCEPFMPVIKDGRMYGRGTCDTKAGLTESFMAVKILKEAGFVPDGDVILESVVDEEFGGANGTIAGRLRGHNADFAINTEPTDFNVYPACLGAIILKISIKGSSGHLFESGNIFNPIYGLSSIVQYIRDYENYMEITVPGPVLWKSRNPKRLVMITKIKAGDVSDHGQLVIPDGGWLEIILQTFPGETLESALSNFKNYFMDRVNSNTELYGRKLEIELEYRYVEPSFCDPAHEGVRQLTESASIIAGRPINISGAPFSCDMFAFEKYGKTPVAAFGAIGANLHAPDEWVDLESVITCTKVFAMLIKRWCGGHWS